MIVTVTPNPSLDRAIEVPVLERGAVIRATGIRVDPGGKGVNVARALTANGHEALAVLPCGGTEGRQLAELLAQAGIATSAVPLSQTVRVNISVVEPDGTVTKLNAPGPVLDLEDVEGLLAASVRAAGDGWLAGCGSLPPGVPGDFYAQLVARARGPVAVDTSGEALRAAVAAGPDLIKPNAEELGELTGRPPRTIGEVIEAAQALRDGGCGAVLVSLGADGAVLVDGGGVAYAETPPQRVASAVGAGDALLAGALARGGSGPAALVEGVAWGAAAAGLPGTRMPGPGDLDRAAVTVHPRPDPTRPLRGA